MYDVLTGEYSNWTVEVPPPVLEKEESTTVAPVIAPIKNTTVPSKDLPVLKEVLKRIQTRCSCLQALLQQIQRGEGFFTYLSTICFYKIREREQDQLDWCQATEEENKCQDKEREEENRHCNRESEKIGEKSKRLSPSNHSLCNRNCNGFCKQQQ